ncbi:hypothetical protein CfE428DRAFT_5789 [Chthoniobacter flavus Ellin428]|uniref:Uncharacterized protein n=2 Tax=Chthoniobacter flavus TaxID=191863 RepID=B4DA49_9BACT|nr:hypothetical protein CfE428DRAFT_5789 [Chthoniobacter flavus Ellin428]TCO87250.1 hypothetical protein EV701_12387 [Chthoniobacter flavus]
MTRPAEGTRVTVNALGRAVDANAGGAAWNHAYRPFLAGQSMTFTLGFVQSFAGATPLEPVITSNGQTLPMSGKDGTVPTPLALDPSIANADGVSWAALEVSPDPATGELFADSLAQIVHTATPVSHAPNLGRCAIAMILWSQGQPIQALPLVHFNLRYLRVLPAAGNTTGGPRHMFL